LNEIKKQDKLLVMQRFVALAFCRADLLFELDKSHNILFSAGMTKELLGKKTDDIVGKSFFDIVDERDRRLISDIFKTADYEGRLDDISIRIPVDNGKPKEASVSGYRFPDLGNHLFIAVKIAPRKRTVPRRRDSDRDKQFDVLTKENFADVAAERIRSLQKMGSEAKVTFVQVNNLEEAQKTMSEDEQSNLKGIIGTVLNDHSLGGDTAGRIDDEKFSLVHRGDVDTSGIGQNIENATKDLMPVGVELTSEVQTIDDNSKELTEDQIAKAIIFTMKTFSEGKSLEDPSSLAGFFDSAMAETLKSVETFRKICMTRDFDLALMPICNLESGVLHHVEALTRFRVELGSSGSPYEMIVMAEEMGIIAEFDMAVGQKAVDLIKKNAVSGRLPPIAINISGHSIGNKEFVRNFCDLLQSATNLSKLMLIEITESSEIKDLELTNRHIQEIREGGFRVALDDFGAGAASFDYLNSFDVDTVKFDGPVVKRAYATSKGKAFLASMATLCAQSGIETIAEMVEDAELAKFLSECGVNYGQGWYFGKPSVDHSKYTI